VSQDDTAELQVLVPLVRAVVRHRKAAWTLVGCAVAGLVAAGGLAARASYQAAQWEAVKAAQVAQAEDAKIWKQDLDARMRRLEAQDGVLAMVAKSLEAMQRQLSTVEQAVARLDGYFQALPHYRGPEDELDRDRRARVNARPHSAAGARP